MAKHEIEISDAAYGTLSAKAGTLNLSAEEYAARILHNYCGALHKMEKADMAEGYAAAGTLNLELSKF